MVVVVVVVQRGRGVYISYSSRDRLLVICVCFNFISKVPAPLLLLTYMITLESFHRIFSGLNSSSSKERERERERERFCIYHILRIELLICLNTYLSQI